MKITNRTIETFIGLTTMKLKISLKLFTHAGTLTFPKKNKKH